MQDKTEEIENIEWTVTGKVKKIECYAFSEKPDLEFDYDPMGQRITKTVYPKSAPGVIDVAGVEKTYYIRDAQGNVMTVYTLKAEDGETNLYLTERNLYGSIRLGVEQVNEVVASTSSGSITINTAQQRVVGDKRYELSNHLGNVLATISDRKLPEFDAANNLTHYLPNVVSFSDYYPFGMQMPNRNGSTDDYRYGFNGMESDDELSGVKNSYDFGLRMYDSRVGRFLSLDPLSTKNSHESNYAYAANNPIYYIDYNGGDNIIYLIQLSDESGELKGVDANTVAKEANAMLATLGVKTRFVVFDEGKHGTFSSENIDKTDSYAMIGDRSKLLNRGAVLSGNAFENAQHAGPGIWIPSTAGEDQRLAELPFESTEQLFGFLAVHGAGHNAATHDDKNTHFSMYDSDQFLDKQTDYVNFMASGGEFAALLGSDPDGTYLGDDVTFGGKSETLRISALGIRASNPSIKGMMDLFDPSRNKVNIGNFEGFFGNATPVDNYQKNKLSKEDNIEIQGIMLPEVVVTHKPKE